MKCTDYMIDLETLGTVPGSQIVSIGVVGFNFDDKHHITEFYREFQQPEQVRLGLLSTDATMQWWNKQEPHIRQTLNNFLTCAPGTDGLEDSLDLLGCWMRNTCKDTNFRVWGNGANFDISMLEVAYQKLGMTIPWNFWNVRCYRTIKSLMPQDPVSAIVGVENNSPHNALSDAIYQAKCLKKFMTLIKVEGFI